MDINNTPEATHTAASKTSSEEKPKAADYSGNEENHMTGNINPNDVATLALLGGDGGGFSTSSRERFDGTVVNNNVERLSAQVTSQHSAIADQIRSNDVNNKMEALQTQLSDTRFELANQFNQNRVETLQQINDARAEAAKCCCETKELVLRENAETRSMLLEQQIQGRDATIQQLQHAQIMDAVGNGRGGPGNSR